MDRGLYNLVIFLDLQKASFDTVNHVLLLGKLEACGIRDNALNLLASYLADRKQTCLLNGKQSGLRSRSCGIPQGSILGPLFFLVYINDLPNCLKHTTPRMFAGDTSLTAYGKSIEEIELGVNEDLEKLDCGYKQISSALMLRRQSICSSVHVKDWLSFPWNQIYVLGVIRSKESEIPKFLECILMNLLLGASILKK